MKICFSSQVEGRYSYEPNSFTESHHGGFKFWMPLADGTGKVYVQVPWSNIAYVQRTIALGPVEESLAEDLTGP